VEQCVPMGRVEDICCIKNYLDRGAELNSKVEVLSSWHVGITTISRFLLHILVITACKLVIFGEFQLVPHDRCTTWHVS